MTGSGMLVDVARAQNTLIVAPAATVPVVCEPFGTAVKPLAVVSDTVSVPADSQISNPTSSTACAGQEGDTAPTPVSAVPIAWKAGARGAALCEVTLEAARNVICADAR